jgi:uncharacterized protein YlxW (UPF0749 family)
VQNDLANQVARKSELETECANARAELRSGKQRVNELNSRVQELQRQLHDLQLDKSRQSDRAHELEKVAFLSLKLLILPSFLSNWQFNAKVRRNFDE